MPMKIIEYDGKYRESAIELMCLLQDHERRLSSDRPPSSEVSADQLDYLVAAVESSIGKIFLAVESAQAVGLIVVFRDNEHPGTQHVYPEYLQYGLITDFVVAESHRGSSVASELLEQAEDFCHSSGLSIVKLSVLHTNAVARSFYEKKGYQPYEVVYRKVI